MSSTPTLPTAAGTATAIAATTAATQPLVLEAVTLYLGGRRLMGPINARIAPAPAAEALCLAMSAYQALYAHPALVKLLG